MTFIVSAIILFMLGPIAELELDSDYNRICEQMILIIYQNMLSLKPWKMLSDLYIQQIAMSL